MQFSEVLDGTLWVYNPRASPFHNDAHSALVSSVQLIDVFLRESVSIAALHCVCVCVRVCHGGSWFPRLPWPTACASFPARLDWARHSWRFGRPTCVCVGRACWACWVTRQRSAWLGLSVQNVGFAWGRSGGTFPWAWGCWELPGGLWVGCPWLDLALAHMHNRP